MTMRHIRSAAVTLLALAAGLGTSTAFAQVGYGGPSDPEAADVQPYGYGAQRAVPYDRAGHFSCGYNEVHTRLERKDCGGSHYRY